MAATTISSRTGMTPVRVAIAVMVAVVLLSIAWALNVNKDTGTGTTPTQSTTDTRPNNTRNIPPSGSVTENGNPADDPTPNPNGTGNNTILSQ